MKLKLAAIVLATALAAFAVPPVGGSINSDGVSSTYDMGDDNWG